VSWRCSVWLVGLLACSAAPHDAANADDRAQARLAAEAKLFFAAVLADDPPSEPCELSSTWDTYPIPEDIARKHLGLRLHASLSAPESGTGPLQILQPPTQSALCRDEEAKEFESRGLAAFEAGTDKSFFVKRRKYTFPVFSADFRTAVIVVTKELQGWYRKPEGVAKLRLEAAGLAVVYRKANGKWRRVDTDQLWIT
jgi:hypothetical protein